MLTQKLLKNHKLTIVESQYYLAPIGAAFLLVGAALTEFRRAARQDALHTVLEHPGLFAASALPAQVNTTASMAVFSE